MKKSEHHFREKWDIIQHTNTCVMVPSEGEEQERSRKKLLKEIIAEQSLSK